MRIPFRLFRKNTKLNTHLKGQEVLRAPDPQQVDASRNTPIAETDLSEKQSSQVDSDPMGLGKKYNAEEVICVERWYYADLHMTRGESKTCCLPPTRALTEEDFEKYGTDAFINTEYMIERRREKLMGIRHADCRTCWRLEDAGVISKRRSCEASMEPEQFYTEYQNTRESKQPRKGLEGDWERLKNDLSDEALKVKHPKILDLTLWNDCNQMCVYCSHQFSSLWEKDLLEREPNMSDERKQELILKAPPSYEKYFWLWFEEIKDGLEQILFIGGEPLIQDRFYDMLDRVLASIKTANRTEPMDIHITSNFNVPKKYMDRFIDLLDGLSAYCTIRVEASVEAYGKRAEYIRHGLKWNVLDQNARRMAEYAGKNPRVKFSFHTCMNNLCVSSFPEFVDYVALLQASYDVPIDLLQNTVVEPAIFTPLNLTEDFSTYLLKAATKIDNKLRFHNENEKIGYAQFIRTMGMALRNGQGDKTSRKAFHKWINDFDGRRGTNFLAVFPEYKGFYDICGSVAAEALAHNASI